MKKRLLFLGIVTVAALTACGPVYVVQHPAPPPAPAPAEPPPADPDDVSYQTFYDQLSPYGQWIEDPEYGYVWMPDAGADFKPYSTNGNWVYTDEGWTWDSGYPWGWAAFHYGRWFFRDGYGWMWMPDNEWAPAWVAWRNSDDYYGWAPLGPSVSLTVVGGYNPPAHYWCFVPHQYISSPHLSNYYVRETNNITIINRTTIISNSRVIDRPRNQHYGYGPDPNEVIRYTGSPLHPIPVRESRAPGGHPSGGFFAVYRPHVNAAPAGGPNGGFNGRSGYAPARYQRIDNVRPVNRTNYGNPGQSGGGDADFNRNNGNNGNHNGWNNRDEHGGNNGNDRGNNGNDRGNNANDRGNNGNHNGWNNRPANPAPSGNPPVNNSPANTPPAGNEPSRNTQGNTSPAIHRGGRFTTFPGAPAGQANNSNNGTSGRGVQPSQPNGQQASNGGRRPAAGRFIPPPANANQPRPVGNSAKPAPDQQHPPHPPGKPDNKPGR